MGVDHFFALGLLGVVADVGFALIKSSNIHRQLPTRNMKKQNSAFQKCTVHAAMQRAKRVISNPCRQPRTAEFETSLYPNTTNIYRSKEQTIKRAGNPYLTATNNQKLSILLLIQYARSQSFRPMPNIGFLIISAVP